MAGGTEGHAAGNYIGGNGIEHGGGHLGGDEAFPDKLVKSVLVVGDFAADAFGGYGRVGGTDGLVSILRVLFDFIDIGGFRVIVGCAV